MPCVTASRMFLASLALAALCWPGSPAHAADCSGTEAKSGRVTQVRDGRTLMLADGREVRLAGIEVPAAGTQAGAAARDALAALIRDREVQLRTAGATDRYGRTVAFAFAGAQMVQSDMIASGHALAGGRIADAGCLDVLRKAEHAARERKRGLWAGGEFRLQSADNPSDILQGAGTFRVVRGKVLSVRESGATIYVNFGRRWSDDFTVTILKRNRRLFVAAGMDPKTLESRTVDVRGYVERRGGPLIEAERPEQIEIVN
ncbi:MAG: thermonuclease family protein [Xanthobacteraceae bacterium]